MSRIRSVYGGCLVALMTLAGLLAGPASPSQAVSSTSSAAVKVTCATDSSDLYPRGPSPIRIGFNGLVECNSVVNRIVMRVDIINEAFQTVRLQKSVNNDRRISGTVTHSCINGWYWGRVTANITVGSSTFPAPQTDTGWVFINFCP
jgi:hypothetical protein